MIRTLVFWLEWFRLIELRLSNTHETAISTIEDPPETAARLFEPQFDKKRPRHSGQPSPGWPQTINSGLGGTVRPWGTCRPIHWGFRALVASSKDATLRALNCKGGGW